MAEYPIEGPHATDRHRTLSTYLNAATDLGCHIHAVAEPGLDPDVVPSGPDGIDACVHLPTS